MYAMYVCKLEWPNTDSFVGHTVSKQNLVLCTRGVLLLLFCSVKKLQTFCQECNTTADLFNLLQSALCHICCTVALYTEVWWCCDGNICGWTSCTRPVASGVWDWGDQAHTSFETHYQRFYLWRILHHTPQTLNKCCHQVCSFNLKMYQNCFRPWLMTLSQIP